jgi:hypothetical protein
MVFRQGGTDMGSVANPLINPMLTSLVPGMNPTGSSISMGTSAPSSNSMIPSSPSGASVSSNPYAGSVVVPGASTPPAFPANGAGPTNLMTPGAGPKTNVGTAAASPIGGMNMMSPKDLSRMFDTLKKTYGDGPAHALLNFMTSGAGFNQDAINNLFAGMQPQVNRGTESLMEQFSTSGNRFGSGAQIGLGDYLSQVNLNEGQIETQMYQTAIQSYLDVLTGTSSAGATRIANTPSFLDNLGQGLGIASSAAAPASAAISSVFPTADTGFLDAIAGAGAFA